MFTYGFEQEQTYRVCPLCPSPVAYQGSYQSHCVLESQRAGPIVYNGHGVPVLRCNRVIYCPGRIAFETHYAQSLQRSSPFVSQAFS